MAFINSKIINTGSCVAETQFCVYGGVIEVVTLVMDNGDIVTYSSDVKSDLKDGLYDYRDGISSLIEEKEDLPTFNPDPLMDIKSIQILEQVKEYLLYLLSEASTYSSEHTNEIEMLISIIDVNNYAEILDRANAISKELNSIFDGLSNNVKSMRAYLIYLKDSVNKAIDEKILKCNDGMHEELRRRTEELALSIDNLMCVE